MTLRWLAGLAIATAAIAAPSLKLYVQETDHAKVIYYDPAHEYLVQHLIRCFENALAFDRATFHYQPWEKVTILLEDFGDFGHGGAGTVPKNFVSVGLEPLSYTFETLPANERIRWIVNHEMIHITMADVASGPDRVFRRFFGGKVAPTGDDPLSIFYSSLASPRHYSPRWYHEGIAAFMETWLGGGMGRAMGGYDEMVFRAMVRDDAYIYDVIGLESEGTAIDFQVGANAYLYGTRFMTHLTYKFGPDKLVQWVSRDKGSKRYFATEFKAVYGLPLQDEWRQWVRDERAWQNANLQRVRQYPLTPMKHVSPQTLGSVSRSWYDPANGNVYAAVRYAGQMAHIAAIHTDTGKVDHLKDVTGVALYYVTSMTLDAKGGRIFYASDNTNWRDLNVLDLRTNQSRRLLRDTRTGDLVYDPNTGALWGMRHHNGLSSVVRIAAPYTEVKVLYTLPFGTDLFDIDLSPDGTQLTGGMTDQAGRQKLVRLRTEQLLKGDGAFDVLHDFEYNTPGNFVFSPDGKYLYGSSYFTGASNLFRYDFASAKMDVVSNCETGLFRPLPLPDGRVMAYEYTAKGFSPAFVEVKPLEDVAAVQYLGQAAIERHPQLAKWKLPSSEGINLESLLKHTGRYSPVKSVRFASIYPIVQGYKDTAAGGLRVEFADRMRIAQANLTASYSPDASLNWSERFRVGLESRLWNYRLTGYYNNADFYDLFGPTKVSRKGYALKLDHTSTLRYDTPRTLELTWGVAGYGGLDRLPEYQNIAAGHHRFVTAKLGLHYSFLEKSLGALEDAEKGVDWSLNSKVSYTGGRAFTRVYGTWDRGALLPLHNSSVWFRSALGKSFGNPNDPFANSYFGGFGNNWVDHQEINRYRQYYSFPGVEINAIGATTFAKGLGEWNLPPVRFRHFGTTAVYCNWMRPTLFTSGLLTNFGNGASRDFHANIGAQLDFRIVLFTYLSSTFSGGYAVATDHRGRVSTEYMVSLKIL